MSDYHLLNTNKSRLEGDNDGTAIYDIGVAATFGPEEYGEKLEPISEGDFILSYVNGVGYRAVGRVTWPVTVRSRYCGLVRAVGQSLV